MKVRKKPVEVEAWRWNGVDIELVGMLVNDRALESWTNCGNGSDSVLNIRTLEGVMKCPVGHYVIKGVAGEFYPCEPKIFESTYESVVPDNTMPENGSDTPSESVDEPLFTE